MKDTRPLYRWSVLSRILAASVGAYAVTVAFTVVLAQLFPSPQEDALLGANLLGFILFPCLALYVFSVRSASRAWLGVVSSAVVLSVIGYALRAVEGVA